MGYVVSCIDHGLDGCVIFTCTLHRSPLVTRSRVFPSLSLQWPLQVRLVDEFLAKSGIAACHSFKDTANAVARVGFKAFLGISADVGKWSEDSKACSIIFKGESRETEREKEGEVERD